MITPDISVIIVSWNACKFLEDCLQSLSSGIVRPMEVIVVDNASTDGSPAMVARQFPWVKLIQTGANLGFSRGNNIGIRESRGRYLALINSDVKVIPGCLDRLAAFLDQNPEAGMVGPKVLYGDLRPQSSCRRFPNIWNNTCEVLQLNKVFPRSEFFAGEHMFYFGYNETREVEVLVGCFIVARKEATDQFGLLDEEFWMYGEDIDWSRRCWKAGWKVMFFPDAEAIHYCGGSSANDPVRFEVAQQQAKLLLWAKHYPKRWSVALKILLTLQCCLRLTMSKLRAPKSVSGVNKCVRQRMQYACLRDLWAVPGSPSTPGRLT